MFHDKLEHACYICVPEKNNVPTVMAVPAEDFESISLKG
jgi:hypothetical protein